jgi:Tfp pilus assembly protein PilV
MPPFSSPGSRIRTLYPRIVALSRKAAGFTMVEVMMAAIVMALAISTSVTTLQVGYRSIDMARSMTLAGQILQSMIEDIRLKTWAQVSALPGTTTGPIATFGTSTSFTSTATAVQMLTRYTFTRAITDVPLKTGMKKIVLTATWKGIDGRSSSVNYTTYYAEKGLYDYYYPVSN